MELLEVEPRIRQADGLMATPAGRAVEWSGVQSVGRVQCQFVSLFVFRMHVCVLRATRAGGLPWRAVQCDGRAEQRDASDSVPPLAPLRCRPTATATPVHPPHRQTDSDPNQSTRCAERYRNDQARAGGQRAIETLTRSIRVLRSAGQRCTSVTARLGDGDRLLTLPLLLLLRANQTALIHRPSRRPSLRPSHHHRRAFPPACRRRALALRCRATRRSTRTASRPTHRRTMQHRQSCRHHLNWHSQPLHRQQSQAQLLPQPLRRPATRCARILRVRLLSLPMVWMSSRPFPLWSTAC